MRFTVTMKTPDALEFAIKDAVNAEAYNLNDPYGDEKDELEQRVKNLCKKWFKYGETVTLIIDTDKESCEVI